MPLPLHKLINQKFILVTGKGGTGKSVVSCALAKNLASKSKKVWIVEMGRKRDQAFSRLHEILEVPSLSHSMQKIKLPSTAKGTLFAAKLDPTESLSEYVALKIPGGSLARILLKNSVTSSLLEIVPGLVEIVTLGKLWYSLTQEQTDKPDLVIVDGPASGHAITLMDSPENFAALTKVGPLSRDAQQMLTFLRDPAQTAVVTITLPEALPLSEAEEFHAYLTKKYYTPLILINRCMREGKSKASDAPISVQNLLQYRSNRFGSEQRTIAIWKEKMQQLFPKVNIDEIYLQFPVSTDNPVTGILHDWEASAVAQRK